MFKGLKTHEAVKNDNGYVVCLSNGNYEVDGKLLELDYNERQLFVHDVENIFKIYYSKPLSHMEDAEGNVYDANTRMEFINKWEPYLDDEDDTFLGTVDQEVEYVREKHLVDSLKSVFGEQEESRQKIQIKVVGSVEDTGSNFIETAINIGEVKENSIYSVHIGKIACDQFLSTCKELDLEYNLPSHGNLEFAKIAGKFIFTNNKSNHVKSNQAVKIYSTLKDAKQCEEEVRGSVHNQIVYMIDKTPASQKTLKDLRGRLNNFENNLMGISVKVKSEDAKKQLLNEMRKEREVIESLIKENN